MTHWFHWLFKPHCPECQVCLSCETLKTQLAIANNEKRQLLESILSKPESTQPVDASIEFEKMKPKMMTWDVRRKMLEAEDRKAAQILAEQKKHAASIEKLEKEIGIEGIEEVKDAQA
jgi:arginyl-tRNA--protein-N-Asp/Glu arginylyltransferase